MRRNQVIRAVHRQIAENTIRDDEIVDLEDFQFFLFHGKKPEDMIQKGDQLIWFGNGQEISVVAA